MKPRAMRPIHALMLGATALLLGGGATCPPKTTKTLTDVYRLSIKSYSETPPSTVFSPDLGDLGGRTTANVPGSEEVQLTSHVTHMLELRGWLRNDGTSSDIVQQHEDGDVTWDLEIDPGWTDHIGLDLTKLFRVGDVLLSAGGGAPNSHAGTTWDQLAVPLRIHMERGRRRAHRLGHHAQDVGSGLAPAPGQSRPPGQVCLRSAHAGCGLPDAG